MSLLATGAATSKPGGIEERQGREWPPLEEPAVPATAGKSRHRCCAAADQDLFLLVVAFLLGLLYA